MEMPNLEEYCEQIRSIFKGKFILKESIEAFKLKERRPDLDLTIGKDPYEIDELVLRACNKNK